VKRIWVILLLASAVRGADVTLSMTGHTMVPNFVRIAATYQATRMFAGIGVRLESKKENVQSRSEGMVIQVRFVGDTPGHPGALAFSNPFDPVPVVTVLYGRILLATERNPERRAVLLAHVLAHEVGHLLMRTTAHSPDGVMKAHWSFADYTQMAYRPLPFLPHDVDLILSGLALSSAASGTCPVNSECTGTSTLMLPAPPPTVVSSFVIGNDGKEVREAVVSPAANVATANLRRQWWKWAR
jgi:hypothetical protein